MSRRQRFDLPLSLVPCSTQLCSGNVCVKEIDTVLAKRNACSIMLQLRQSEEYAIQVLIVNTTACIILAPTQIVSLPIVRRKSSFSFIMFSQLISISTAYPTVDSQIVSNDQSRCSGLPKINISFVNGLSGTMSSLKMRSASH